MSSLSVLDVKSTLEELSGLDFSAFEPRMIENAEEKLKRDVAKLQANPLLKNGAEVRGAIYDVDTGKVNWVC
jgi:carbonic anhydrase